MKDICSFLCIGFEPTTTTPAATVLAVHTDTPIPQMDTADNMYKSRKGIEVHYKDTKLKLGSLVPATLEMDSAIAVRRF